MDQEDVVYIYTMEYYMAMRKNEIWLFVAKWMDLDGVMLSEISLNSPFYFVILMNLKKKLGVILYSNFEN